MLTSHLHAEPTPAPNIEFFSYKVRHHARVFQELRAKKFRSFQMILERGDEPLLVAAALDEEFDFTESDATEFYEDLVLVAKDFMRISGAQEIGIKLESLTTDACALFHTDQVQMRLITTFFGSATEWLRNEDANRGGLFKQNNSLVHKAGRPIQRMETGDVAIMKGDRCPGFEGGGLIHRSPSIQSANGWRLILRMDKLI